MLPADPLRDLLTVERIVAVEPPREFRLSPRDRVVAFTAEAAGARQVFLMSLRGGTSTQVTAGEKPASDPQWSPGMACGARSSGWRTGHGSCAATLLEETAPD